MRPYLIFLVFLLSSCNSKDQILHLLESKDKTKIMLGCSYIDSKKDSIYIPFLLNDIDDGRISHDLRFYGMSVYQCKINALRRISNIDPPKKVTDEVDTININFYKQWATENGYLK